VGVEERKDHATVPNVKPAAALRYLKTKKFWIAGVVEDELLKNARGVLLSAIETGELAGETMAKLLGVFEPWVGDETKVRDGEVVEPYRLETVVRTNVTDAYNRGRLVEGREAGELLVGFQYSAVLDDRTTEICRELDGKVFRPGDPALDQVKPPNHFNCRSVLVPITIDTPVEEDDFATAEDVGAARDLMDPGFGGAA
jgi:SPP1 gp7 family putative phage head morphogenesis protein